MTEYEMGSAATKLRKSVRVGVSVRFEKQKRYV